MSQECFMKTMQLDLGLSATAEHARFLTIPASTRVIPCSDALSEPQLRFQLEQTHSLI